MDLSINHVCIIVLLLCWSIPVMSYHTHKECDGNALYCKFKDYFHKIAPNHSSENIYLDTIRMVFSSLGVSERIKRSHGSYRANGFREVVTKLANKFPSENITTKYDFVEVERTFFQFCRYLLSAAVTYDCVPHSHHPHCRTNYSTDKFDNASLSTIYSFVRPLIIRRTEQNNGQFASTVGFEVEAYANRFLCTDEEEIRRSIKADATNAEDERDFGAAVITFKLIKGYNFLKQDEICPGSFLHDIFGRYAPKCMTVLSLERLYNDLIHGQPPAVRYQDTDNSNQHPYDDRRQVQAEDFDKLKSLDNQGNNHKRNGVNQGPGLNGQFDRQCHSENWPTHNSRFLHQTSHSLGTLHHSWRHDKHPLGMRDIVQIYYGKGENKPPTFDYSAFLDMCPAILHQALFAYNRHISSHIPPPNHSPQHVHTTKSTISQLTTTFDTTKVNGTAGNVTISDTITTSQSYLYGSLSVLIISLCSLLGAVFMKLPGADLKVYIMGTLLSLAVGCLVADAALHLLPEVILDDDGEATGDDVLFPDHVKKLCAFLGSVFVFFVLELFLAKRQSHDHKGGDHGNNENTNPDIQIVAYRKEGTEIKATNLNNQLQKTNSIEVQRANNFQVGKPINTETNRNVMVVRNNSNSSQKSSDDRISIASDRLNAHDAGSGIKALAWMIILGDGIHNFADGLAIGAAFSLTFTKGLSISITVLCHEIPHELGDFAVLITTGMSIKKAVVLNFLSSLTAFAGLYVGLLLGAQEETSKWIFSVGAGMFLYVALTDLVPECKEYVRNKPTMTMYIGQIGGILAGYMVMLLLAMYEDKLEI